MIKLSFLSGEKINLNINFGIIINPVGTFGGAQRRFTNLFRDIYVKFPDNAYCFVSYDLLDKIKNIYPQYPLNNVIPIGKKEFQTKNVTVNKNTAGQKNYSKDITKTSFLRKLYRYLKSYFTQYNLYKEIEKYRKENNIRVLIGVYSGILPLYFYLNKTKRKVGIVFCDMDSCFRDILPKEKKYWYRKYSSFNYALENSDYVDFLSPFILKGVKERGMNIREDSDSITPCSFTDYSKCKIGDKSIFQVAFAGRLEKDKNPDLFLEAAIILSKKYPEILFHIMGEGRLSSDIKEKVNNSGLGNIIFHGFHPQPTEILLDTSVFVSIQTTNNYPSQSVLEAMGCGNAIVASDVGDTRMFINKDNGILIKPEVVELVSAIENLYVNKEFRERLGKNAFSYVRENHTIEKMAEYYVDLFKKASSRFSK